MDNQEIIEGIKSIESEFYELLKQYDPNCSSFVLDNYRTRLCIVSYTYTLEIYKILAKSKRENIMVLVKSALTYLSYIVSAGYLFVAPKYFSPAFLSSFALSLFKMYDFKYLQDFITEDTKEYLIESLDKFSVISDKAMEEVNNRIDDLNNENNIIKLKDDEFVERMANKMLIDLLEKNRIEIKDEAILNKMQEILKNFYNIENLSEADLFTVALNDYLAMDDKLYHIQEKTRRLSHMSKKEFYG